MTDSKADVLRLVLRAANEPLTSAQIRTAMHKAGLPTDADFNLASWLRDFLNRAEIVRTKNVLGYVYRLNPAYVPAARPALSAGPGRPSNQSRLGLLDAIRGQVMEATRPITAPSVHAGLVGYPNASPNVVKQLLVKLAKRGEIRAVSLGRLKAYTALPEPASAEAATQIAESATQISESAAQIADSATRGAGASAAAIYAEQPGIAATVAASFTALSCPTGLDLAKRLTAISSDLADAIGDACDSAQPPQAIKALFLAHQHAAAASAALHA
jgi:hypothetical protein